MKIISLVNQKGGSGKSVLAQNLAVTAEQSGEKVCLIDLDPQSTTAEWYETRAAETPQVIAHDKAGNLTGVLHALEADGFTLVVIDTKGEDSHGTRGAMQAADLCVIPIQPLGPDLRASRKTVAALAAMKVKFAMVLNRASTNKNARITGTLMGGLQSSGPVVPVAIANRVDVSNAYALGQGVTEYAPDSKAAEEFSQLWAWCRKTINTKDAVNVEPQQKRA